MKSLQPGFLRESQLHEEEGGEQKHKPPASALKAHQTTEAGVTFTYLPVPRLLCLSLGFIQVRNDKSLTPCFLWGSGIIFKPPGGERHPVCRRLFRLGVQMACSCSPWRHARALLFQTAARLPADSLGSASAPGLSLHSRAQPPFPGSASTPGLSLHSPAQPPLCIQPPLPGSASVPGLSLHSLAQPRLPGLASVPVSASTPGHSLRSALSLHSWAQPPFPGSASTPGLSLHSRAQLPLPATACTPRSASAPRLSLQSALSLHSTLSLCSVLTGCHLCPCKSVSRFLPPHSALPAAAGGSVQDAKLDAPGSLAGSCEHPGRERHSHALQQGGRAGAGCACPGQVRRLGTLLRSASPRDVPSPRSHPTVLRFSSPLPAPYHIF